MEKQSLKLQWAQLLTITFAHMIVDIFAGMLPALMPVVRERFDLTLNAGTLLLGSLYFTCNIFQIFTGHMRANKTKPYFMYIGLVLAVFISLLAIVPQTDNAIWILLFLVFTSGIGIAVVHPEGFRAIHTLEGIPSPVSTTVFLSLGFVGFSAGGYIATMLVTWLGLKGLYFFLLLPLISIPALMLLRVRVAVEEPVPLNPVLRRELSFWPVLAMTLPIAATSTVIPSLLPTRLNELGFELTFGGMSNMIIGLSGVVGSIAMSRIAARKGELRTAIVALLIMPLLYWVYFYLIGHRAAVWMLFVAGLFYAYPMTVSLARQSRGPKLGQRMALSVGGAWGIGSLVLLGMGPIADRFGVMSVLWGAPVGFLLAALIGIGILVKYGPRPELEK